jgi:hypothetical protein
LRACHAPFDEAPWLLTSAPADMMCLKSEIVHQQPAHAFANELYSQKLSLENFFSNSAVDGITSQHQGINQPCIVLGCH